MLIDVCRRGSTEKGGGLVNRLMLVRIQSSALIRIVRECAGSARQPPKLQDQVRFLDGLLVLNMPGECAGQARQSSKLQDEVRFLGAGLSVDDSYMMSSECGGFARDSAKVEDQVRFLARTLAFLTLEPDGTATACKAVLSGFDSHRRLYHQLLTESRRCKAIGSAGRQRLSVARAGRRVVHVYTYWNSRTIPPPRAEKWSHIRIKLLICCLALAIMFAARVSAAEPELAGSQRLAPRPQLDVTTALNELQEAQRKHERCVRPPSRSR